MAKEKEKFKFIFPNFVAKGMAKVDMRTQMEAGLISQFLLLTGLTIMVILMLWTTPGSAFYVGMIVFNLSCGWLLISSNLITTYQQYTNYMDSMGYDPQAEKAAVKASGNIFKRINRARKNKKMKNKLKKELKEKDEDHIIELERGEKQ